MESRARVAICIGLIAAVALVATIVQQSESGLIHESDSEMEMGFDAYPKFTPEASFDEGEFSLVEIDESKTADPRVVIGNLIALRAYCKLARDQAVEFLDARSTNTALPSFIAAFGAEPPKQHKPAPMEKDGIILPGKWKPTPFNVVTWYAKAMGSARKKFAKTGGVDSYVLDNIDASIVNGHRAVLYTENSHKKNTFRVQISPPAMGVTEAPNYIKVLDQSRLKWAKTSQLDEKQAEGADILRAASLLKVGAKNTYKSFMTEAMLREHSKYEKYHLMEEQKAFDAIQKKYATKSGDDGFKNVRMLPSAGKEGASSVPLPKYKSAAEIKKEAQIEAAAFVKHESKRKGLIRTEIAVKEHDAKPKL